MQLAVKSQLYDTAVQSETPEDVRILYQSLAEQALDQLAKKQAGPAMSLASDLSNVNSRSNENKVVPVLKALSRQVGRLDSEAASPLVESILEIPWSEGTKELVDCYVRFLAVLVSGIPRWWQKIIHNVAQGFVLPLKDTLPHHRIIQHISQIIPTSSTKLGSIVAGYFPHKFDATDVTVNYVRNSLKLLEYCPEQQRSVWGLLIEKMMQLDVECEDGEESDSDSDSGSEDDSASEDEDDSASEDEEAEADAVDNEGDSDSDAEVDVDADVDMSNADIVDVEADAEADFVDIDVDVDLAAMKPLKRRISESEETNPSKRVCLDDLDEGEEVAEEELQLQDNSSLQAVHDKLDLIMIEVLQYLDKRFTPEALKNGDATPLFIVLLDKFKEFVLPTHTTRSVQYVIFHTAHAHPDLLDAFVVSLVEMALSPTTPIDRRQKAMQYISSFVARAKGLSRSQIVFVVGFLAGWVEKYISEREGEVDDSANMSKFRMFYSVVQALFYIFCFRHDMLQKPETAGEWEADINKVFQRVIVTKFNPLRYCKSTVVAMFARIANEQDVAYCFSVMEQNRIGRFRAGSPVSSPTSSTSAGVDTSSGTGNKSISSHSSKSSLATLSSVIWPNHKEFAVLEGYFPFDPLSLKRSQKYFTDIYVEWDDVNEDQNSDSASLSDSDEE